MFLDSDAKAFNEVRIVHLTNRAGLIWFPYGKKEGKGREQSKPRLSWKIHMTMSLKKHKIIHENLEFS